MAGLERKATKEIREAIRRMADGELLRPVAFPPCTVKERAILTELELLRKRLLKERDRETEREKKFQTTVASVAHDLKTPLAVLSGYAECLEDGIDDKDYAALIRGKAAQMNEMVLTILDAAKNEAGGETLSAEPVAVQSYFRAELEKYAPLAKEKHVAYEFRDAPNVVARIDRAKMGRLVQNLVTNAVKYTPDNGKIEVKFYIWQKRLAMEVSDTGVGIEKKNLPLIFDKFFREDSARSGANSGLGLFIAKEIATAHGGDLDVKSKKGKGSRFTLRIPYDLEVQERKRPFDRFPRLAKLAFALVFGWFYPWYYRLTQFTKTRHLSTLVGGLFAMPLFVFFWLIDLASIAAYDKITFLAD